jgi:ribonuclease J
VSETGRASGSVNGLRVIPLGGLGEIGMNCMVLETEKDLLVIDAGILFSDLDHFGVEFAIPDFSYLTERREKIGAILLTHGHEDHIGALPFLIKAGIHAPVYASEFTAKLVRHRLREHGLEDRVDLRVFRMGDRFATTDFGIETVSVNHSIVDAAALFIDTPFGRVIHTGDFKIDPLPFYGEMIDLDRFKRAGDEGVLLLLSDSTNVERHSHSLSESVIYQNFEQLFAAAQGLTVVAMFASNVGRLGQILQLAKRMDRKVALSGRGMEQNAAYAQEIGYLKDATAVLIPLDEIEKHRRDKVIVVSTGSQAEFGSALQRMAHGEHKLVALQPGDRVMMSSRYIPGNEKAIGRMINDLFRQGAEVLYEAVHEIHASGHATRPELKQMLELVRPRFFVPIHGEYRHLVHHSIVAKETGMSPESVRILVDGDVAELDADSLEVIDHFEDNRILIEGREGGDVSKLVLKDRRSLGERGIVFSLLVRNAETGAVLAGPEIITKGLAKESMEGFLVEEGRKLVSRIVAEHERGVREKAGPPMDLQETIRVGLRRFFLQNVGFKPTVLPVILEL